MGKYFYLQLFDWNHDDGTYNSWDKGIGIYTNMTMNRPRKQGWLSAQEKHVKTRSGKFAKPASSRQRLAYLPSATRFNG
jgi:hypothetical protein